MSAPRVPLSALIDAHAVLREIHELVGPDPKAGIPGKLYTRLVSAEFNLQSCVERITRELSAEVTV
jgi:hypothetical protein